jgi:hypothetical protein
MDTLQPTGSALAGVHPEMDAQGQLSAIRIDLNLSYSAVDGGSFGRGVSFDIWPLLSAQQKTDMQGIQNTISQYVYQTYFA